MTPESKLGEAFVAYLNFAKAELHPTRATQPSERPIQLLETKSMELLRLVEEIESTSCFAQLVEATAGVFPHETGIHHLRGDQEVPAQRIELEHFFRSSRCYTSPYSVKEIDATVSLRNLNNEFRKKQIQVRHLLPMRFVQFGAESIEFDGFQIRRFSVEELNEILKNDVNEVFFRDHEVDVNEIQQYWFIDFPESVESLSYRGWGRWHVGVKSGLVKEEFGEFPKPIAGILEPLILYDWESASHYDYGWNAFDMPFALRIADDFLSAPRSLPYIPKFEVVEWLDEEGGEELSDPIPMYKVDILGSTLDSFQAFVGHVRAILIRLESAKNDWYFLEVALLFLTKAFFSEGIEQLLWHITVVESLVGEKKVDVSINQLLQNRVASIFGETKAKSFKHIYDLRSKLVHGDKKLRDQKTVNADLLEARNLARQTLVWFLHYLEHIERTRKDRPRPSRKVLLNMLDHRPNEHLKDLLSILPADFPRTPSWLDQ